MARVLVTGAAGFIGVHVCEALLKRGEKVIGFDAMTPYNDPALKKRRLQLLESLFPPPSGYAVFPEDGRP